MPQYQIVSIIAGLILSHWSVYLFFRRRLKVREKNYLNAMNLLKEETENNKLLREANEHVYEKGKRDAFKATRIEMEMDHQVLVYGRNN